MTQAIDRTKLNKPVLKRGSSGNAVKELQQLLLENGALSSERAVDGIFGVKTEAAVKTFQHWMFLVEDGIVAQKTWQALFTNAPVDLPLLKRGSRGNMVKILQETLRDTEDYQGAIDGYFGTKTEAAVRSFQARYDLAVDGIVGEKTWQALTWVRR